MNKPKLMTMEEFEGLTELPLSIWSFNLYHGTDYGGWIEVLGEDWANGRDNTPEIRREYYIRWYNRNFTKLGKALK